MVLDAHRDLLGETRGVEVPDEVLQWLLDFCEDFLRNRVFPDKAVDLLEQCVATAVMNDECAVDVPRASAVAQEMVGMPIDLGGRLASLARRLTGASLLDADGSEELLARVGITMRGLRPASEPAERGDPARRSGRGEHRRAGGGHRGDAPG